MLCGGHYIISSSKNILLLKFYLEYIELHMIKDWSSSLQSNCQSDQELTWLVESTRQQTLSNQRTAISPLTPPSPLPTLLYKLVSSLRSIRMIVECLLADSNKTPILIYYKPNRRTLSAGQILKIVIPIKYCLVVCLFTHTHLLSCVAL